jgi:hypothetical protein
MIKAPNISHHMQLHEQAATYANLHLATIRTTFILEKVVQHSSHLEIK